MKTLLMTLSLILSANVFSCSGGTCGACTTGGAHAVIDNFCYTCEEQNGSLVWTLSKFNNCS